MSDEHPTLPLPDPGAGRVLPLDAAASGSRARHWPWIVALVAVALLAVAAWFAGEYVARGIVERTIRERITTQLNLPADHRIDVDVPGPILPQLLIGSLGRVSVASEDVSFGGAEGAPAVTGDVVVVADDVPLRGDGDWSGAFATVTLDEEQLSALLGAIEGFPTETVTLDPPNVGISLDLQLFALTVPVGVDLTPRAEHGQLVLTPASLRVAGVEISADGLVAQFGILATTVIRDWDVCVAQYYPAAIELTAVRVERTGLVIEAEIASAILHDPAAREHGTCP